ncbi:MAG TPA: SMP-30/gluconolactonase/LRE family protein [Chitinophagaceae bacterium]|jgi:sugar lactone lactonase YvrE|nr:SMP-30/gluconolactonase/LRE family protein [Chitinophagaceae bacterium]
MRNILSSPARPIMLLIVSILITRSIHAQGLNDYDKFIKAYTDKKYTDCIQYGEPVAKFSDDPGTQYALAECYCQAGAISKSLDALGSLAKRGLSYKVKENKNFSSLYSDKRFIEHAELFTKNAGIDRSSVSFVINDSLLIPEGMAYDPSTQTFFISSLSKHKVIGCSGKGDCADFANGKQSNFWMGLGMKVSPDHKSVWVCSASEHPDLNGYSGVFQFEISSGKLLQQFVLDNKKEQHLFNDIFITQAGDVYFTDSKAGKVWRILPGRDTLTEYATGFIYPNGIAVDEAKKTLFVADFTGLYMIDLNTGKRSQMNHEGKTYLNDIDGMYFYKGSLVVIQNSGNQGDRIARFYYDIPKKSIVNTEVLQTFRKDFIIPTTGAIVNNELHYIANSQLRSLQPDGRITNPEKLVRPVILKVKLD